MTTTTFKKDYGYAIGVIRALETKLLSSMQYNRMMDSNNAKDAYTILNDTDFSDFLVDHPSVYDFEKVLEKSLISTKNFLIKITPNNYVLDGMWKWYDIYNLKTVLKGFLYQSELNSLKDYLSPLGTIDNQKIINFVFKNQKISELEHFLEVKTQAEKIYEEKKDFRFIDFTFDKFLFDFMLQWIHKIKLLREWDFPMLKFIKKKIDITNLQNSLRLTEQDKEIFAEFIFIPGGNLEIEDFLSEKNKKEMLTSMLKPSIINDFFENKDYRLLKKQLDDVLIDLMHNTRYISEGPIPVIGYWWARRNASDIIRSILVGKINNVHQEKIRKYTKKIY